MKTNGQAKKAVISFVISILIFSLAALLFSLAFMSGRNNRSAGDGNGIVDPNGQTLNILLLLSDYAPEKFDDYDAESVKNVMGITVPTPEKAPESVLAGYRKVFVEQMAIARVDTVYGKVVFIPISGDTLVTFKGLRIKLGEIAGEWGVPVLVEKVHAVTGLEIDNYAVFSPQSAAKALDYAGSIDYTLKCNMKQTDSGRGIDIDITAGSSRFDGKMTVDLLRFDSYEKTGTTRSEIVSGYLKKLVSSLSEKTTKDEISKKIKSAFELSNTDLDTERDTARLDLAASFVGLSVEYTELDGRWQTVENVRYFVLDETETLKMLSTYRDK